MESEESVLDKYAKFINPAQARLFRFMGMSGVEDHGKGWLVTDSNGREYIDCLGGYGAFALGHCHPEIVGAVSEQLKKMPLSGKVLLNKPMADLAEKLARITPGDLQYSFFVNSGTEAVEGCLKIARLATKRKKFVAAKNAFHGKTMGSLTATGRDLYREPFQPLLTGFTHISFGNIAEMEQAVDEDTAAVILEPIQGEGGIIIPPAGYLKQVEEICHKKGALLIMDEVQTGIGRTGKWFGCNYDDVKPDLMAVAKALGGGIMPIGAVIGTENAWQGLIEAPFLHTSTFGGGELACVAGLTTLDVIGKENLLDKADQNGRYLLDGLRKLKNKFPEVIQDVRGRGMMLGMELVKEGAGGMLMNLLIEKNVLVAYTLNNPKVIRLEPPLVMPRNVLDKVLEKLDEAFGVIREAIEDL